MIKKEVNVRNIRRERKYQKENERRHERNKVAISNFLAIEKINLRLHTGFKSITLSMNLTFLITKPLLPP